MAAHSELLRQFRASHPYREIDIEGITWRYISCGEGVHTIVMIHGFLVDPYMWFHQIQALEHEFRIIAPSVDVRGKSLDQICRGFAGILEAERADQVTMLGISAGGAWAQYFLCQYPQVVARLILSHTGVPSSQRSRRAGWVARALRWLPFGVTRLWLRLRSRNYPNSAWNQLRRAYFADLIRRMTKQALVDEFCAVSKFKSTYELTPDDFRSWNGDVFILSTADDSGSIRQLEQLRALHPRAKVHMFPHGGHHTVLLFPDEYTAVIRGFLKSGGTTADGT